MINLSEFSFYKVYADIDNGDTNKYVTLMNESGRVLIAKFTAPHSSTLFCIKSGNYETIIAGLSGYTYVEFNQLV